MMTEFDVAPWKQAIGKWWLCGTLSQLDGVKFPAGDRRSCFSDSRRRVQWIKHPNSREQIGQHAQSQAAPKADGWMADPCRSRTRIALTTKRRHDIGFGLGVSQGAT